MKNLAAILIVVCAASLPLSAQRGRRNGPAANQGIPLATNTILRNPGAYYGKQVTVSAGVDQMVSKTVFLMDQWKAAGAAQVEPVGQPILVLAPYLTNTLDRRNYLIVRGELVKLDLTAVARVAADYKIDLGPEIWNKYQGRPMLIAASVINSTYTELDRKPIAPPTASELAMSDAMKTISPAFAALRAAADESKADAVKTTVATLLPALSQTESIWDGVGQSSASQFARDAQNFAAAIERDASTGNWEKVKFAAGKLNQVCANCHGTFRDRADDGSYRFKAGSF